MKKLIVNTKTFLISLVGLIGGVFWAITANWTIESLILISVSFLEIIGYIFIITYENIKPNNETNKKLIINNKRKIKKQIIIQDNNGSINIK